jgi:hypothetical protein
MCRHAICTAARRAEVAAEAAPSAAQHPLQPLFGYATTTSGVKRER